MILVYILILLSLNTHTLKPSLMQELINMFHGFHTHCLKITPAEVNSVEALQALVCGKNFESGSTSELLIASGLIHLFVVSGAHLSFLRKIIDFIVTKIFLQPPQDSNTGESAILAVLFLYCAVCDFNPPIVRSYLSLILFFLLKLTGLRWKPENLLLMTGLICLILEPRWVISVSLQMSWLAGIALIIIERFYKKASVFAKSSLFYVQFLTTFNFLGLPSFLSIGISAVLTPLLEYFLFPLALLVYLAPCLSKFFDFCIFSLENFLQVLNLQILFRPYDSEKMIWLNWLLIMSLHFLLNLTHRGKKVCFAREI